MVNWKGWGESIWWPFCGSTPTFMWSGQYAHAKSQTNYFALTLLMMII